MRRVLFISERPLFRHALAHALSQEEPSFTVEDVGRGDEALEKLRSLDADVVLLHIGDTDGMRTIFELQEGNLSVPIVLLLDIVDDAAITAAIQSGVAGCLDSSVDVAHLSRSLKEALSGEAAFSDGFARRLAQMLVKSGGRKGLQPVYDRPTPRELEVLKLMSLGLKNADIAGRLSVSESTVRAHIRAITQKLSAHNRVHAVACALSLGMISDTAKPEETSRARID
jgi:DNA-binding NarL/FixJ family response regulator